MTQAEAVEAILQFWAAAWAVLHPADVVPWATGNEVKDSAVTWVRITVAHTSSRQLTMGVAPNRKWERRGRIAVEIYTPTNGGTAPNDELADDVRSCLEGVSIGGIGRVTTYEGAPPDPGAIAGRWYRSLVIIPFRYVQTR